MSSDAVSSSSAQMEDAEVRSAYEIVAVCGCLPPLRVLTVVSVSFGRRAAAQFLAADEAVQVIAADEVDATEPMDDDMEDAMIEEEELTEEEQKQRAADDAKTAAMGLCTHRRASAR